MEEEYLRRHAASLAAYKKGVQIAREYLGPDNDITRTLIKSCKAAQEHLDMSQMKKSLANSGGIRQGEKMGAAYHALQQHNDTKRRAQSAGAQRSQSATPRLEPDDFPVCSPQRFCLFCMLAGNNKVFRGRYSRYRLLLLSYCFHCFHLASWAMDGERSLSRPSTSHQAASSKSLSRVRAWVDDERNGDSSIVSVVFERGKGDMKDRSREEQRHQDGYSEDGGHVPGAARARPRPASALGALDYRGGNGHSCHAATAVVQSEGRMGAKRGPVTPRLEEGDQKVSAIRRPASASLREPVRANLKASEERESLEKKLRRVDEEEEHKQSKSYAWEEGNESGSDNNEQELIDDDPQDSRNSNRRIAYGQPDRELGRSGTRPWDVSPQRAADRLRADSALNGRSDSSGTSYSSSGRSFQNGGGRGLQLPSLDDDMLDNLDLEEGEEDDVDSGTEALMQIREQGAKNIVRPASATLARPSDSRQRGAPASRPSQRPASASFAVIHERRARDQAKRPSSAAPVHAVPENKYAVVRAASDSSHPSAAGQMLDCPVIASDRAKLRPASASFTRPASASFTRNGSERPMTASTVRPASANIVRPTSQDLPQDEMARSSQREEREILDILSDHSDYESDLELEAETRALNKHSNLHRPQNNRASVRSRDQGLEVKRAQLLAKTELGLDHSLYESDDQHQDRQLVQGTLIGERSKRPSDSGRTQRPSDKARAPAQPLRPSDRSIRRPSRPSSFAPPGRLHEEVLSPSGSEYESDHANAQEGKLLLDDMSGTLKWLEDGLTTRQD